MANETRQILIESILGGVSNTSHFAAEDQFLHAVGIDPGLPFTNIVGGSFNLRDFENSSGLLEPVAVGNIVSSTSMQHPVFIIQAPKTDTLFVYGSGGSVYTYTQGGATNDFIGLTATNSLTADVCGAAYYDNYIYFCRSTTVARYGPLNSSPTFTEDYWVGILGLSQLTADSGQYPVDDSASDKYPQHVMHRHGDGKLYFADIVNGQGVIHYISTTKATIEGDTNNGSTFNALDFGFGLIPTAIESYGSYLAVALFENGSGSNVNPQLGQRAKLALWDTTSQNFNLITNDEFPDEFISAMKNVNGTLYIASGNRWQGGFRVSKYIGGYSFEEVAYITEGQPPFAGAMLGSADRLIFGSRGIYSLGLEKSSISRGLFKYGVSPGKLGLVYSLCLDPFTSFSRQGMIAGWYDLGTPYHNGVDVIGGEGNYSPLSYTTVPPTFSSKIYRIGVPFKITSLSIPIVQGVNQSMIVTPTFVIDDNTSSTTLAAINNTNFSGKKLVTIRPSNLTGEHNFWLRLDWSGSERCTVGLPITIRYEIVKE